MTLLRSGGTEGDRGAPELSYGMRILGAASLAIFDCMALWWGDPRFASAIPMFVVAVTVFLFGWWTIPFDRVRSGSSLEKMVKLTGLLLLFALPSIVAGNEVVEIAVLLGLNIIVAGVVARFCL